MREIVFFLFGIFNQQDKIDPYWVIEDKKLADTVYCICMNESRLDTFHDVIKKTKNLAGISTHAKTSKSIGDTMLYGMKFHKFRRYDESLKLASELVRQVPMETYWGCHHDCTKYRNKFMKCINERRQIDPVTDYINEGYERTRVSIGRLITKTIRDIRGFFSRFSL